jgi:hypothetical protein
MCCGDIWSKIAVRTLLAGDGCDIDNAAVAGPAHHRDDRAVAVEEAVDVDIEDLSPRIDRIVPGRRVGTGDSRRADEDVDATQCSLGPARRRLDRVDPRHVDQHRQRVGAHVRTRVDECRRVAVPQRDARAACGEAACHREADPGGSSGDHRAAIAKVELIHRSRSVVGPAYSTLGRAE